jgi:NAD(P)H-nitrite reductase large subunit
MSDGNSELLICRCEEVTRQEILRAIELGAHTLWQVRRMTRAGMGLCQGRSCQRLAAGILAEEVGAALDQVLLPSYRPPVQPVPLEALCSGEYLDLEHL